MSRQTTDKPEPTLEEVRVQFETWRKTRNSRRPIPDQLWQAAVKLSKNYSVYKIAKTLRLDYTKLKNFTRAGTNHHLPIVKDISPAFIELGIGACSSEAFECIIDINRSDGAQMKMQFKGSCYFDPLELCKAFWDKMP
jgi:hypothetical protein